MPVRKAHLALTSLYKVLMTRNHLYAWYALRKLVMSLIWWQEISRVPSSRSGVDASWSLRKAIPVGVGGSGKPSCEVHSQAPPSSSCPVVFPAA